MYFCNYVNMKYVISIFGYVVIDITTNDLFTLVIKIFDIIVKDAITH